MSLKLIGFIKIFKVFSFNLFSSDIFLPSKIFLMKKNKKVIAMTIQKELEKKDIRIVNEIVPSPISAFGGKFNALLEEGIQYYFPKFTAKSQIYVEMFCYSAVMFFNLRPAPMTCILNDKNSEVINFFRVIKNQLPEIEKELEYIWLSPQAIEEYKDRTDPIGKAILFYLRNKNGFSGINSVNFHYNCHLNVFRKHFGYWKQLLDNSKTALWDLDWRDCFKRINDSKIKVESYVIYQDPPYVKQQHYENTFTEQDHRDLAKMNYETEHHIIVSYADDPLIRELYDPNYFDIKELSWMHSSKEGKKAHIKKELLISNRKLVKRFKDNTIQKTLADMNL